MTCDLVVFNNAIPVKPFTVDVVMGFDEEGNTAYYWLKKNHSVYEFYATNTCGLPRYVVDEDDEAIRYLQRLFGDMFCTIPEFGTKEDLESYVADIPSPDDIKEKCKQLEQEDPDLVKGTDKCTSMYKNIKEAAKRGCRFCVVNKDYVNQLFDVVEIEVRDSYNHHVLSKTTKEE